MKKSSNVVLGLLAAAALAATTGCNRSRQEVRNCVDENNQIVGDLACDQQDDFNRQGYRNPFGYHWWYGGSSRGRIGDTVFGGYSTSTSSAHSFGSVTRGGFGASMGSSAS
jgi:hypothetical protein